MATQEPTVTSLPEGNENVTSQQQQQQQDANAQSDETIIPPMNSIYPAIFVPLASSSSIDITAPFVPPANRVEQLRALLADLNQHAASVRANMLDLVSRERERIIQEGRRQGRKERNEGNAPPEVKLGLEPDECAQMIANMEAPHRPGASYDVGDIPPFKANGTFARSLREWAALEVMRVADQASQNMEGYEVHIAKVRNGYEQALKEELNRQAS